MRVLDRITFYQKEKLLIIPQILLGCLRQN